VNPTFGVGWSRPLSLVSGGSYGSPMMMMVSSGIYGSSTTMMMVLGDSSLPDDDRREVSLATFLR